MAQNIIIASGTGEKRMRIRFRRSPEVIQITKGHNMMNHQWRGQR